MNAPSGSRQVTQDKAAARGRGTDGRTDAVRAAGDVRHTDSEYNPGATRSTQTQGQRTPHTKHSEPPQARVHAGASGTAVTTKA